MANPQEMINPLMRIYLPFLWQRYFSLHWSPMIGGFYAPVDQRVKFESGSKKDLWQMENENLFGRHTFVISFAKLRLIKFTGTIFELKAKKLEILNWQNLEISHLVFSTYCLEWLHVNGFSQGGSWKRNGECVG